MPRNTVSQPTHWTSFVNPLPLCPLLPRGPPTSDGGHAQRVKITGACRTEYRGSYPTGSVNVNNMTLWSRWAGRGLGFLVWWSNGFQGQSPCFKQSSSSFVWFGYLASVKAVTSRECFEAQKVENHWPRRAASLLASSLGSSSMPWAHISNSPIAGEALPISGDDNGSLLPLLIPLQASCPSWTHRLFRLLPRPWLDRLMSFCWGDPV